MKQVISYRDIVQNIKSHLLSDVTLDGSDIILGLNVTAIVKEKTIMIIPDNVTKEEVGNGVFNRLVKVNLFTWFKTGFVYMDIGMLNFLDWTQKIEESLENHTFDNKIINSQIEIEEFDVGVSEKQGFVYGALLVYEFKIKEA